MRDRVIQWLLNMLGQLGEFFAAILKRGIQDQLNVLLPMALEVCSALAHDSAMITNRQKREVAFSRLMSQARDLSITAAVSTINLAIELAVQKLKAEAGK